MFLVSIAMAGSPKRLFIVHSYERGHICGQPQHDGAVQALAEAGFRAGENLEIGVYHMDSKKRNNTPELIARQGELARQALESFAPDLLLTLDDNAFRTVALAYAGKDLPVVFSGMNAQPEHYEAGQLSRQHSRRQGFGSTLPAPRRLRLEPARWSKGRQT